MSNEEDKKEMEDLLGYKEFLMTNTKLTNKELKELGLTSDEKQNRDRIINQMIDMQKLQSNLIYEPPTNPMKEEND